MYTLNPIAPDKLAKLNRWANLLPSRALRHYAFGYIAWLKGGATGPEPRHPGISERTAQDIRAEIDAAKPWEDDDE